MDDKNAIVRVAPSVEIGGATLLGKVFSWMRDADSSKAEQDVLELTRAAVELGPLLGFDTNTKEGAACALKAVLDLTNLGLDHASRGDEVTAARLIAKNNLQQLYEVGRALVRDTTRRAGALWERSVIGNQGSGYVGFLMLALERELIRLKRFALCATVDELKKQVVILDRAEIMLALVPHIPTSLLFGTPVSVVAYETVLGVFRRPSRDEPSPRGGVLPLFMRTLFVKCMLGGYRNRDARIPHDYTGVTNWRLHRDEVVEFVRLALCGEEELGERITTAMPAFEEYFLRDAREIGASVVRSKKQLEEWFPLFDTLLRELVAHVNEFYRRHATDGGSDEAINRFWVDKVVLGERGLYAYASPPIEHILKLSLCEARQALAGFAEWSQGFQRAFVDQYPFTERLILKGEDVRVADHLIEALALLRGAHKVGEAATNFEEQALARVRLAEVSILIVYALFVKGPEWVKGELMRRVGETKPTSRALVNIFKSQRFVSGDYSDGRFLVAYLLEARRHENFSAGRWETLLEHVPLSSAFAPYFHLCPSDIRRQVLCAYDELERHPALETLTSDELRALFGEINPEKARALPDNLTMKQLIALVCHYGGVTRRRACTNFHLISSI